MLLTELKTSHLCQIFDPTALPVEPADLQQYGNDDVKRLATHYAPIEILATLEECLSEWSSFKQFVKEKSVKSHADMIQLLCTDSKLPNSKGFQLRDFAIKLSFKSYSFNRSF